MVTTTKRTPENRNKKRMSVSVSGPAYMVAIGGSPRGSKGKKTTGEEACILPGYLRPLTASCRDGCKHCVSDDCMELQLKTNEEYAHVLSRYLKPSTESCHDRRCKHGAHDEYVELRWPNKNLRKRKSFAKNKRVRRTVVQVERKKITTKPKPSPNPKIRAPEKTNQNNLKNPKTRTTTNVKTKPRTSLKNKDTMMTKKQLKRMITKKVEEMALKAETEEVEFVPPTIEIIETSPTPTNESANVENSENDSSSSNEHTNDEEVLELEERADDDNEEDVIFEDDYEVESLEGDANETKTPRRYRVVLRQNKDDEDSDVKFRKGRVLELESDDGPDRLKFRRGRIVDNEEGDGAYRIKFKKAEIEEREEVEQSETVQLKHQEVQEKEAQELFNSVIEETANKLVEDMKTKVGALVGAFETVISLQEDPVQSSSE